MIDFDDGVDKDLLLLFYINSMSIRNRKNKIDIIFIIFFWFMKKSD